MVTTGNINETISITGSGLFQISAVVFAGEASGDFREVNKNIFVTVPKDSAWGRVRIESASRNLTSYSKFLFVPSPIITGFYPLTGLPNSIINVRGYAFSGVTGITVNNLNVSSFSVLSNSGISFSLPSGNTKGFIKLFAQSGLTCLSSDKIQPFAYISGLDRRNASTGDALTISGSNFLTDIIHYNSVNNSCYVSFNGATGEFKVINSIKLTGSVPENASSGPVNILKSNTYDFHPSSFSLNIIPPTPVVSNVYPSSGNVLNNLIIYGSNFKNVTGIDFCQGTGKFTVSNTGAFSSSSLNNTIYLNVPNLYSGALPFNEGKVSIKVFASGGIGSGYNVFHLKGAPTISGFYGYGQENDTLRISGSNLYLDSVIYFNSLNYIPVYPITGSDNNAYLDISVPGRYVKNNNIIINNGNSIIVSTGVFSYVDKPSISGFSPLSGLWGSSISIYGTGFDLVTGVSLNDQSANFTSVNDTGINIQIPSGILNSYIKVKNAMGESVSSGYLIVVPPSPVINSYYPNPVVVSEALTFSGNYLNYVTGIVFSGRSGLFTVSNFYSSGNTLYTFVPNGAISQRVYLRNKGFETGTSGSITILYPPKVTGVYPSKALPSEILTLSGENFSGCNFYFKKYDGNLISSTGTNIVNSELATTYVPYGIVTDYISVSGNNKFRNSNIVFNPLPKIISSTLTGNSFIGSQFSFKLINGYEVTGFLVSGSGEHFNIIDKYSDLSFGYDEQSLNYVKITGYINGQFYGTGNLYPIFSGWTDFNSNISSEFSGAKFISGIRITGGISTISGFSPRIGSFNTLISISGTNLKRVENVILSGKYLLSSEFSNIQSFKAVSDKLITGILGNIVDVIVEDAEIKLRRQDWLSNGIGDINLPYPKTSETSISYLKQPYFSNISPNPRKMSIFTGTNITLSGQNFQAITSGFLRDAFGNRYDCVVHSPNTSWGSPATNTESIKFTIPTLTSLTDKTYDLCILNTAGITGLYSGVKVYDYYDVSNLNDLETKIYVFS